MKDLSPLYAPDDGASTAATAAPVDAPAAAVEAPNPHSDVVPAKGTSRYGTPITGQPAAPADAPEPVAVAPVEEATAEDAPPEEVQAQAAPAEEAAVEDAPNEEAPDAPAAEVDVVAAIRRAIPGAPVTDASEVGAYVGELYQHAQGMSDLRSIVKEVPELATFFQQIHDGDKPRLAAVEAFRELARVPDQMDDPEAWGEWNRREGERAAEARLRAEREAKHGTRSEQRRAHIEATRASFAQRHPDADVDAVHSELVSLSDGDQLTGRFRGDAFDVVYKAMNHDAIVAREREEAATEAREKLMAEIRNQNKASAPETPLALGGGGAAAESAASVDPSTLSPEQQRRHQLAVALHGKSGQRGKMSRYGTPIN